MKTLFTLLFLFAGSSWLAGYSKAPDSGLLFHLSEVEPKATASASDNENVQHTLLIAPNDLPERGHFSNSSMARVELLAIGAGGHVAAYQPTDPMREQVFIILEGSVEFEIGPETITAALHDVVFVPPAIPRGFRATSEGGARVLRADWTEAGAQPRPGAGRAVLVSEKRRPLVPTNGEGYLTVMPNPRQEGFPLSILGYGASHINASNSLLLYPLDIATDRMTFTGNTRFARMGLSEYRADGGTRWHFHPDREQCFVILAGKGLVEIGANTVEVKAGDIVFAPRHVGHGYKTTGDEPLKFFELEWGRN